MLASPSETADLGASATGPFQDRERGRRDPSARAPRDLQAEWIERPAKLVHGVLAVRVKGIHVPAPIAVAHRLEAVEGGPHSRVPAIAEGREGVESDEDVVVIVDGIVEPEPRTVRSGSFSKQTSLEVEFRASLDRSKDGRGPRPGGPRREDSERRAPVARHR